MFRRGRQGGRQADGQAADVLAWLKSMLLTSVASVEGLISVAFSVSSQTTS